MVEGREVMNHRNTEDTETVQGWRTARSRKWLMVERPDMNAQTQGRRERVDR